MQFELARVFEDELFDDKSATKTYKRLLELRAGDPTAEEAIERGESKRKKWKDLFERYLEEADQTTDDTFKSSLLMSASEVAYRYGERNKKALSEIAGRLETALKLDAKNLRVASPPRAHLPRARRTGRRLARVLEARSSDAPSKEERAASLIRLGSRRRDASSSPTSAPWPPTSGSSICGRATRRR